MLPEIFHSSGFGCGGVAVLASPSSVHPSHVIAATYASRGFCITQHSKYRNLQKEMVGVAMVSM